VARIYLDAWGMKDECGITRYIRNVIPPLLDRLDGHEVIIIRSDTRWRETPIQRGGPAIEVGVGRRWTDLSNVVSRPTLESIFRRHGRPDLYHSFFHLLPLGIKRGQRGAAAVVITLHDFIWIDYADYVSNHWIQAEFLRRFASAALPYALRTADHVICNSAATARRAHDWISEEATSVVHMGLDPVFFEPVNTHVRALPQAADPAFRYVAAIAVKKRYKNLATLIDAFAVARRTLGEGHLVLLGDCRGIAEKAAAAGIADAVTLIGRVSDEEMRAIFARADLFVLPSIVEGFGLPVLEAMASGAPVAVSDAAALTEIAGDAALQFPARDVQALADLIARVWRSPELRQRLREQGRQRAATFGWSRAAEQTVAVYHAVLSAVRLKPDATYSQAREARL
jgi:glycosyltransferase involved in cell wall biosynthesis